MVRALLRGDRKQNMSDIRAVSKLAGVSVATVSRAFTHPEKVAKPTLEKVLSAASQLSYKPNSMAQLFRTKQTNTIVVMAPDLANAFYSKVLEGVESVASENGLSIFLANSHDRLEIERSCLDMVLSRRADGLIQLGAHRIEELADGAATKGIAFVHAVEFSADSLVPAVGIDNELAGETMVQYLLSLGHRKIGVIAGGRESKITRSRLNGYRSALNAAGIAFDPSKVEYADYSIKGGIAATRALLERCPDITALFCMSDDLAIGAMAAATEQGLSVPNDLSVSGFDNIEEGEYLNPPLTTITQPARRMGRRAMELMIDMLSDTPSPARTHILDAELIVRKSVAPLA